jgi:hypothetical protein
MNETSDSVLVLRFMRSCGVIPNARVFTGGPRDLRWHDIEGGIALDLPC